MSEEEDFEDDAEAGGQLVLDLDGFEGPLDLLLTLARDQKVDLGRISILRLADQYLEFVARMRHRHLELAAEYLVMAAWLAYLKSRLLLPQPEPENEDEPSAAELAEILAFRLKRLEAMKKAGQALLARPRLGRDFFGRGDPEPLGETLHSVWEISLFELLKTYSDHVVRTSVHTLTVEAADLMSVDDALRRLEQLIGHLPDWSVLSAYLPRITGDRLAVRAASAATFVAALELARQGRIILRQDGGAFSPIRLKAGTPGIDERAT